MATVADQTSEADPGQRLEAAHATAAAVVGRTRDGDRSPDEERVVRLAEEHGLEALAALWAQAAPDSLPGALWRLYALRAWVRTAPREAARLYAAGAVHAPVLAAVAGVPEPPGPEEVAALADTVLAGLVRGELDVALDRAAAFCRLVAAGRAELADEDDERAGFSAVRLLATGEALQSAARAARAGHLV